MRGITLIDMDKRELEGDPGLHSDSWGGNVMWRANEAKKVKMKHRAADRDV